MRSPWRPHHSGKRIAPRCATDAKVGLQKVANRITVGLVIAAMIVSATMMMRIPSDYTILGYPWLAMILFVMAAGSAGILLFNTFIKDSPFSRKSRKEIEREG